MIHPYFLRSLRGCAFLLPAFLSGLIPAAMGQQSNGAASGLREVYFPSRAWLPPVMSDPTRLSSSLIGNDEFATVARDGSGRIWVVWATCRPATRKVPAGRPDLEAYEWSDQGEDSIVARYFDGQNWSAEQPVSASAGVNYRPVVLAEPHGGVRVLWTARRNNAWSAWERRWTGDRWEPEMQIPASDGALEIAARVLTDGSVVAVTTKPAAPRLQLDVQLYRNGRWSPPERIDQGEGRCHRPTLLDLPNGAWIVAWDEERAGNYDIYARRSGGAVERLTDTEVWDTTPALARTADGRIWIAWERKETIGGRAAYRGRSIFGKYYDGSRWQWAPSPYERGEPGRLTQHNRFWATEGIAEERFPHLLSRANGELWLLWLGGGRESTTSFSGRVWRQGKWSEPMLIFHNPVPNQAFGMPSANPDIDLRRLVLGPFQTPLFNELALTLDDAKGLLWMSYTIPLRGFYNQTNEDKVKARPAGYGAAIFSHHVDLDQRELRFPRVVEDAAPPPPLTLRPYHHDQPKSVEVNGQRYLLVYGDMHGHTENDAFGTVDMFYTHGLFVTGMDFLALTNHESYPDFLMQSEWALTQALAGVYNKIPERVVFSGYEWSTNPSDARGGHRAMYFLHDHEPLYRSTTTSSNTVQKMFGLLKEADVIMQPHHNGWAGYDPVMQPVVEITSAWRQEREQGAGFKQSGKVFSAWEALDRGYRIGFAGSGDSHWMGPGEDNGITGAYVTSLTREGVFDAIRKRRIFASTGARMIIDFRVNGAFLGASATASSPPHIEVKVDAESDLDKLEIVRDGRFIYSAPAAGRRAAFQFVDKEEKPQGRSGSYYYLRVTQKDSSRAWASPVWVDWR
jgi:hypothetical protein